MLPKLLLEIQTAATAAQPLVADIAGAAQVDALALLFLSIAQKAIAAHEQIKGEPIDLTKLHEIAPLP